MLILISVCGSAYRNNIKELEVLVPKFEQLSSAIKTRGIVKKVGLYLIKRCTDKINESIPHQAKTFLTERSLEFIKGLIL